MITTSNNNLSILRDKFVQKLMLNGKKAVATNLFEESLEILRSKIQKELLLLKGKTKSKKNSSFLESLESKKKLEIFEIALNRAKPWLSVVSTKRGGKVILVPRVLTPNQQQILVIRWLVQNIRGTKTKAVKSSSFLLANELYGCLTNQGKTMNQRQQLHQLAESNRANIGFVIK